MLSTLEEAGIETYRFPDESEDPEAADDSIVQQAKVRTLPVPKAKKKRKKRKKKENPQRHGSHALCHLPLTIPFPCNRTAFLLPSAAGAASTPGAPLKVRWKKNCLSPPAMEARR